MIAYLLTDAVGRQSYMVNGVKSGKRHGSRSALLQPMFVVDFEGLTSPKAELHRFKEVETGLRFATIPFDIRKSTISLFMAEVLYRLVRESEPNSPLFDFILNSIQALDMMEEGVANFHLWFLVGLSRYLGFYPADEHLSGSVFDIKEGRFSPTRPRHELFLSEQNTQILGSLMSCDASQLASIELNRGQRVDFLNALLQYFGYHLDSIHSVQSIQILQEVF